ncbi:MAG TPA: hypothetical protein VFR29_10020 [Steroidobacteraceae bacterium]|nr:hypothetical protein [Steroidobacteraceae bacterium]
MTTRGSPSTPRARHPGFLPSVLLSAACACGLADPAAAEARVSLTVGQAEFEGLRIDGLEVGLAQDKEGSAAATMRAARIRGIASTGPLSGFSLDCPSLQFIGDAIHCPRGRLRGTLGSLGAQDTAFTAQAGADGSLRMALDAFSLAAGRAKVDVQLAGSRWQLDARVAGLDLAQLAAIARPWMELPEGFTVAGAASGTVRASGGGDALRTATVEADVARLDFADAEGLLAGEAVAGTLGVSIEAVPEGFAVRDGRLELAGGQAYSDPVFLDFGAQRATLDFAGRLRTDAARFEARAFTLDHLGVLQASGQATLDFAGESLLPEARVKIAALELATALPAYLQPFLVDSAFKDLEGIGRVSGELEIGAGLPKRAQLQVADVSLDSSNGALFVGGLNGQINWFDDASRSELAGTIDDALFQSRLAWDTASLWGIEVGAAVLPFSTTGRHFRLLEPLLLPVFDGGLAIETLRVRHAGTGQMYVRFDATVRPISVAPLARAFGWPEFQGTLSGSVPDLQWAQGIVTLGGNLEATVFDGSVVVRDLQLRDPLGKFPRLFASVDVRNLDLALVTSTFSFGMITGRLSGEIKDLETFAWMPESFDARFYTPPGDRSRHRISQRAVQNLSSIGGGTGGSVAAALQGGFLKFFDDFGYDRLGLSCRLVNDVCTMGGIQPAATGFYIVKGSGLPRIDVIGNQTRVAWSRLVRQLARITESDVVVE